MPRSEEFQADRKTRRNRVERKKPSKADNESEVLTESDNDNEEGEEEATGGNKWRCLKMVVVSAVLILVVYGMLGFIISNEVDDQGKCYQSLMSKYWHSSVHFCQDRLRLRVHLAARMRLDVERTASC